MFLQKKKVTSNASRIAYTLKFNLKQLTLFNVFFIPHFNSRGRSSYNGKVVRTKSSLKTPARLKQPFFSFKYLNSFFYLLAFKKTGVKARLSSLGATIDGLFMLLPKLNSHSLFMFYKSKLQLKTVRTLMSLLSLVIIVQRKVNLCYIESKGSFIASFVKSPGSKASVRSRNTFLKSALVNLPSNARKYFFFSSFCLVGSPASKPPVKTWTTKSGYYRKFGINTLSRGVARNPVDHPNGGRTKTLKCPKTPWGFVAKKK